MKVVNIETLYKTIDDLRELILFYAEYLGKKIKDMNNGVSDNDIDDIFNEK